MYCAKEHLTTSHLKQLYYSLIYPYLIYGILIWGSTAYTRLREMEVLQKRVVKLIPNAPPYAHTEQNFKALSLLKLQDTMKLYEGKYMYKQLHGLLPEPLLKTFAHNFEIHPHYTRRSRDLHKFPSRTTLFAISFLVTAPGNWSLLPESIKSSPTLGRFESLS